MTQSTCINEDEAEEQDNVKLHFSIFFWKLTRLMMDFRMRTVHGEDMGAPCYQHERALQDERVGISHLEGQGNKVSKFVG